MKYVMAVLALFLAFAPYEASAVFVRWRGELTITASSGVCSWNRVGHHYVARFQPSGIGSNGTDTQLALFDDGYAQSLRRVGGRYGATFTPVSSMTVGAGHAPYPFTAQLRFATVSPAVFTASTRNILVTGQVRGFDFDAGCTVTFNMILEKEY